MSNLKKIIIPIKSILLIEIIQRNDLNFYVNIIINSNLTYTLLISESYIPYFNFYLWKNTNYILHLTYPNYISLNSVKIRIVDTNNNIIKSSF